LITGLTEGFRLGEGDSLGEGLGVGVCEGDGEGELASPKTFLPKLGRKIDFKNNPEPPRIKSRTTESINVGLEGLLSAIKYLHYTSTTEIYSYLLNHYNNFKQCTWSGCLIHKV